MGNDRRPPHPSRLGRTAQKPCRVPARLRRRRKRPDRHRAANGRSALPSTAFVSPHAPELCPGTPMGRQWFPLTMRDPRELVRGVARGAAGARRISRRRAAAASASTRARCALVGFSQGTMLALHVGPQRRRRLAGILGYSGLLADPAALKAGAVAEAAGAPDPRRSRRPDPGGGDLFRGARGWRRRKFRSSGTSRRAFRTASGRTGWRSDCNS